jgi:hypothetical protein
MAHYQPHTDAVARYQARHKALGLCILCNEPGKPKRDGSGPRQHCAKHVVIISTWIQRHDTKKRRRRRNFLARRRRKATETVEN